MAVSQEYKTYIAELLERFGAVTIRNMFGGAGVYLDKQMFALIADETLYLKADAQTIPDFEKENCGPFTYEGKGKPVQMSYYQCPAYLYDDPDEMASWARRAYEAALRGKKGKQKKR